MRLNIIKGLDDRAQVGKTTTCRALGGVYLNWDNDDHRGIILCGPSAVALEAELDRLAERHFLFRMHPFSVGELVRTTLPKSPIRPPQSIADWYCKVAKGLRKEPKWYLRDWSGIEDKGRRGETMLACQLLKAVETWTDLGLGDFELRYVRDKKQREQNFSPALLKSDCFRRHEPVVVPARTLLSQLP